MKKLVLGIVTLCVVASAPIFANNNPEITNFEVPSTTNFSVRVNSGTAALVGATVQLYQDGVEIASGVTNARGIVALSVPNQEAVTIKISASGHSPETKADITPTAGEIIPVVLHNITVKPSVVKPKK